MTFTLRHSFNANILQRIYILHAYVCLIYYIRVHVYFKLTWMQIKGTEINYNAETTLKINSMHYAFTRHLWNVLNLQNVISWTGSKLTTVLLDLLLLTPFLLFLHRRPLFHKTITDKEQNVIPFLLELVFETTFLCTA